MSDQTTEHYLRQALRELADAADIVENSTDWGHWRRLYRAIEQARRVLES